MTDTRHPADIFSEARQRGWRLTSIAVDNRRRDRLPTLNGSEQKTLESILILAALRLPEASDEDLLRLADIAWDHVSDALRDSALSTEVPPRTSMYDRPKHKHGDDEFPVTKSGLRSSKLASHMSLHHAEVMQDQLAANGYSIGRVSHTWLSDVHAAHHAGDL